MACSAANLVDQSSKQVELSNMTLKKERDIGEPNIAKIKELVSKHDFNALDNLYDEFLKKYEKDVLYEWYLNQAYSIFTPNNDMSIEDLDMWVAKTGSYVAYAARGGYKTELGLIARGAKFIADTPDSKIQEMQRWHNEAAKDLQIAITKKSSLISAYSILMEIATASNMPFTARQILDGAEIFDKRTFYVKAGYMNSLLPRWGGTYREMSEFAQSELKYLNSNPRLWTLQGAADADRADDYYREENYAAAIESYTQALKFGDCVTWLKYRAACYYKQGKKDEATADYKRVLYYSPANTTALEFFASPGTLSGLEYDLSEHSYVDPKIHELNIKSCAVLSVEHKVNWLNTRPDKGKVIVYNNIAKIERMLRGLGYNCLERSKVVEILDNQKLSLAGLSNEKAQQIGKLIKADAVIIATIPSMGKNHSRNMYFEDITIKAISVTSGQVVWSSQLKGSVVAGQNTYDYTLILDSMESKLYDLLQAKLKTEALQINDVK